MAKLRINADGYATTLPVSKREMLALAREHQPHATLREFLDLCAEFPKDPVMAALLVKAKGCRSWGKLIVKLSEVTSS